MTRKARLRYLPLTVHYMIAGVTACGLPAWTQGAWPPGHRWVSRRYEDKVDGCATCVAAAKAQIRRPGVKAE
jgi:hypothetical protein